MDEQDISKAALFAPYSGEDYVRAAGAIVLDNTLSRVFTPNAVLSLGFTVPLNPLYDSPVQLRSGGSPPTLTEQVNAAIYGQNTNRGFNFFGQNVSLPPFLSSVVRTHTSARLALLYRNTTGSFRNGVGQLLDAIHPGMTTSIDSEGDTFLPPGYLLSPLYGGDFNDVSMPTCSTCGSAGVFHPHSNQVVKGDSNGSFSSWSKKRKRRKGNGRRALPR
jgi:hypothetical protein